jgi:hypothetical protein
MIWSGLTILAFIVYHLLHFTVRVGNTTTRTYKIDLHGEKVHNVYKMVIDGFSWAPASIFYIIAMALLCSHLSHGFSSLFQTLGISTDKSEPLFKKARLCLRRPDLRRQLLHRPRHLALRLRSLNLNLFAPFAMSLDSQHSLRPDGHEVVQAQAGLEAHQSEEQAQVHRARRGQRPRPVPRLRRRFRSWATR